MKLEVKDLRKSFGDKEVLHGISFSIESGRALGLLGRNGAGKTTTIRILMDVFRANSGTITVDGKPFHPKDFRIGYLPEERGLYPKKGVQEQLMYLAQLRGSSRNDSKKQAENERQKILADMASDAREKTNLVKKTLATQRAKYGASGASGRSMSTGAVLARLKSETAKPYDEKRKSNTEKLKQIRATRPNLLQMVLDKFDDLSG